MSWRPEGWILSQPIAQVEKDYKKDEMIIARLLTPSEKAIFEAGADAMLETLKKEGSYLNGDTIIPSQGKYPEIHVPGGTKGWVVIIPDV